MIYSVAEFDHMPVFDPTCDLPTHSFWAIPYEIGVNIAKNYDDFKRLCCRPQGCAVELQRYNFVDGQYVKETTVVQVRDYGDNRVII